MKTGITIFAVLIFSITMVNAQTAGQLLKDAIYQEEVNGDLEKAISIYRDIVQNHAEERRSAAEALFRLGLTNEKLGQQQATDYYRQVIRQYADQSSIADQARNRLSFLTSPQADPARNERNEMLSNTKLATLGDIYGQISPDGQRISFIHWNNGGNLALHEIKTGKSRDLTDEGTWAGEMQFGDLSIWSPDSRKIAYTWYTGPKPEMRIYDTERNTYKTVIPYSEGRSITPIYWNRDNEIYFIFCSPDCKRQVVSVLEVATGKVTEIEEIDMKRFQDLSSFRISPDGRFAAYTVKAGDEGNQTFVLPFPTGQNEVLATIDQVHLDPVWAGDSKGIFYASVRYGNTSLYLQNLENGLKKGEERLVLESMPNDFEASVVNPETGDLYYTSHTGYYLLEKRPLDLGSMETGNAEILINSADNTACPAYSPDGKKLAFLQKTEDGKYGTQVFIQDLSTGQSNMIDYRFRNIDWLGPTHIQWTDDSRFVIIPFKPLDSSGKDVLRLAFADISTGQVEVLEEELGSGAKAAMSKHRFIIFESGAGLVDYDREAGTRTVIQSIPGAGTEVRCITPNAAKDHLVYFRGSKEFDIWMKELVHVNLKTGESKILWSFPGNAEEGFFNRTPPNWVGNGNQLVVCVVNSKKETQQYYLLDVATGKKSRIGDPVPADAMTYFTRVSPDGREMIYARQKHKSSAWVIRNIR